MNFNNKNYDNLGDKKELYNIIENYLDERLRREYLEWCCKKADTILNILLRPGKNSSWHPKEVFWQLMSLAYMHNLNLDLASKKLVEVARLGQVRYNEDE